MICLQLLYFKTGVYKMAHKDKITRYHNTTFLKTLPLQILLSITILKKGIIVITTIYILRPSKRSIFFLAWSDAQSATPPLSLWGGRFLFGFFRFIIDPQRFPSPCRSVFCN